MSSNKPGPDVNPGYVAYRALRNATKMQIQRRKRAAGVAKGLQAHHSGHSMAEIIRIWIESEGIAMEDIPIRRTVKGNVQLASSGLLARWLFTHDCFAEYEWLTHDEHVARHKDEVPQT